MHMLEQNTIVTIPCHHSPVRFAFWDGKLWQVDDKHSIVTSSGTSEIYKKKNSAAFALFSKQLRKTEFIRFAELCLVNVSASNTFNLYFLSRVAHIIFPLFNTDQSNCSSCDCILVNLNFFRLLR